MQIHTPMPNCQFYAATYHHCQPIQKQETDIRQRNTYVGFYFQRQFKTKREIKSVRYNADDLDYHTLFLIKPVLRPEYGILFEWQGFLMQGLHRIYLMWHWIYQKNHTCFMTHQCQDTVIIGLETNYMTL